MVSKLTAANPNRQLFLVKRRLRKYYGIPVALCHGDPLAELILTVLSQSTNDRNRDIAYTRLRAAFPSWEEVRDADTSEIELAIRPGGISKVKSVRIKQLLEAIGDELDLTWLKTARLKTARGYLCSLPGVGRKTAACVLLFAYGREDIPVDTHVSRVGERLGIFSSRMSLEERHDLMLALTPKGSAVETHVNILRHGRRVCTARNPRCHECVLSDVCPAAK